jgi:hypothetical protein
MVLRAPLPAGPHLSEAGYLLATAMLDDLKRDPLNSNAPRAAPTGR